MVADKSPSRIQIARCMCRRKVGQKRHLGLLIRTIFYGGNFRRTYWDSRCLRSISVGKLVRRSWNRSSECGHTCSLSDCPSRGGSLTSSGPGCTRGSPGQTGGNGHRYARPVKCTLQRPPLNNKNSQTTYNAERFWSQTITKLSTLTRLPLCRLSAVI